MSGARTTLPCLAALVLLAATGCSDRCVETAREASGVRLVRLHPFTSVKPSEGEDAPGGIDARVEALSAAGDPVRAFGVFRFQLHRYRQHQADPRGRRLATWTLDLREAEANERFWDAILLAYKIPLGAEEIPATGKRLVLELVFCGADGRRLFDRRVLEAAQ